jgi:hypothetical protein
MKHLYRICAGIVLTLVFALPTLAGQMPCPGITDQPPPPTAAATTEDNSDTSAGVVEALVSLLQGVLFVL